MSNMNLWLNGRDAICFVNYYYILQQSDSFVARFPLADTGTNRRHHIQPMKLWAENHRPLGKHVKTQKKKKFYNEANTFHKSLLKIPYNNSVS